MTEKEEDEEEEDDDDQKMGKSRVRNAKIRISLKGIA